MDTTLQRLSQEAAADPLSNAAFEIWFLQSGFPGGNKMAAAFAWEELRQRLPAQPRPWHYVTEKLPEPWQRVLFFSTAGLSHVGVVTKAGEWFTSGGHRVRRARVYAWQSEPEPPPLPEAPVLGTTEEWREEMASSRGDFREEAVDPDLLQALKDAAERKL